MGSHVPTIVWEWMANGNIMEFIKSHENANRFKLVWSHSYCQLQLLLMILIPAGSSGT